jgi:hypothetical protein
MSAALRRDQDHDPQHKATLEVAAHYFVNEPVIERSIRDAIALGVFPTPLPGALLGLGVLRRRIQLIHHSAELRDG